MSAKKCNYSIKYKPLVLAKRSQATTPEAWEAFRNWVYEKFSNPDVAIALTNSSWNENNISVISRTLTEAPEKIESIRSYFRKSSAYNRCVKDFSDAVVNAAIFTADGEWIDANANTRLGISTLNVNLANYKLRLVNDINLGLPSPRERIFIDFSNPNADNQLTTAINDALLATDQFSDDLNEDDYTKAYTAYVILKNFNSLLQEKTPFIKIKKEYEDSAQHGINMYEYTGPNVSHRNSWTQNEHISAESQYSDLASILLNYFRECSGDTPIDNTSIGVDGFTSVMNRFKTALFYTDLLKEHRTAFYDGNFNIKEALIAYRDKLVHQALSSAYSKESLTTQINKLSGIIHYCFDDFIDDDVQEMFRGMFEKTVPLAYFEYAYNNGEFSKRNLSDYYVNRQVLNLKDIINGRVYTFRKNPSIFNNLKSDWNLNVGKNWLDLSRDGLNLHLSWQEVLGKSSSFDVIYDGNVGGTNDKILAEFISDLLGVYLPLDGYSNQSAMLNQNGSLANDFKEIIAMVVAAANRENAFSAVIDAQNVLDFRKMFLFKHLNNAAITLSAIYGTESRNVVTDINGHKLPTNGLTSLVQNAHKLGAELASLDASDYENPYRNNPLVPRKDADGNYTTPGFGQPIIRQGVKMKGKTKPVSQLTLDELLEISIAYDFLDSLGSDTLFLQNGNFADKERHWIIPYNIRAGITIDGDFYDTKKLIEDCAKTGDSEQLQEVWRRLRASRYDAIAANVLIDYNTVLGTNFTTLKQLDSYLLDKKYTVDQLRQLFRTFEPKINFKEEVHATNTNGIARVNEVLMHYQECFDDPKLAEKRLAKSRAYFAKDIFKSHLRLNRFANDAIKRRWNDVPDTWKQKRGTIETGNLILFKVYNSAGNEIKITSANQEQIINPKNKVVLNPILEAYLLSDIIYSNEFNQICTGDVFAHPNKKKVGSTEDNGWGSSDYYDFSEASRLVAANKRAVIYGGAIHSFSHDLYGHRGTEKTIKTAVISDPKSPVWTLTGGLDDKDIDDSQDVFDGSGLQSIYQAIFEQQSLKDAAAGFDEKTILGHVDKYFGGQKLLKWAVYALTNERRRKGRNSDINVEQLFKKMHNIVFDANLDIAKIWTDYVKTPLYYYDINTNKNYRLLGVESVGDGLYVKRAIECDDSGEALEGAQVVYLNNENKVLGKNYSNSELTYNTIYSLDQLFGGAYEKSVVNGKLQYTTNGNYIVADIMCDNQERYGLKENFISYVVNTSAMKVGAENVNPTERYTNNDALDYMEMSTEYGGLQMNAEHELEDSEVTEMTQMISALIEKGFNSDLVNQIYGDIGSTVLESLKKFKTAIAGYSNNPEQLRIILGRALIEAYAKGDRDTLGLAQSFLMKAQRMLKDSNIEFKFPFSGATINGSFVSTVASLLTKKGIRRKYAGVAAVLTPSHNMTMVYGTGKNFESYAAELRQWRLSHPQYLNVSIDSLINDIYVTDVHNNEVLNPFIVEEPFDFEDTIVIENEITKKFETVKLDSLEKFYKYKFDYSGKIYKFASRPRNLKASNTTFSINGVQHSIWELTSVRAANIAHKKNWTEDDENLIYNTLEWAINRYSNGDEGEIVAYKNVYSPDFAKVKEYIASRNKTALGSVIDINKTFYNIVQMQINELSGEDPFVYDPILTGDTTVTAENVNVEPAEIILGKMWAKQFHLQAGDDVQDILNRGTDFFEERLNADYNLPADVEFNQYDAIIWTSDKRPILVKIDRNLDYDFNKSRSTNINVVDGIAYIDEKELANADNKAFYTINSGSRLYDVIVIQDASQLSELTDSTLISQYKLNSQSRSIVDILSQEEDETIFEYIDNDGNTAVITAAMFKGWPIENQLSIARRIEETRSQKRLHNQAIRMADSFRLSLQAVGTRIPSQAMQSFQPMKIVAFTDSETNDVYVNRFNFYLEGSDLDIDKTYILTYQVNNSGEIDTGSKLSKIIGVEKALALDLPTGKRFEENSENAQIITRELASEFINGNVDIINSILRGSEHLLFDESVTSGQRKQIMRMLQLHESSRITEDALKNRVVHNIRKVVLNPRNQQNLFSPINMDTQRAAAERSDLGKDERNISIDVPSSKFMMQEQNMVGKQCIGITAVSIKTFFAKSTYYNQIFRTIPNLNDADIINVLSTLTFDNPINERLSVLANINITDVIDNLPVDRYVINGTASDKLGKLFNNSNGTFRLKDCLRYLQRVSNRVDAAMELSGLLSASTDNAKELLLSKINATSRFIDVFTVALQAGVTFDEISDLMMSPMFNYIARLASNNIFKPYQASYKVETAIKFYLGEALLPGVKSTLLRTWLKEIKGLQNVTDSQLYTLLKDNTVVEQLLKKADEALSIRRVNNLSDDGFDLDTAVYKTEDYLGIQDFLEECLDRNIVISELEKLPNYRTQRHNLELILNTFIPATEEQQILGAMLSINQGLPNSAYEQYSYIKRIENFVSKRIREKFDLMQFINNPSYAEDMRQKYEAEKKFINILDVIKTVPHFAEMFNSLYDNNFILTNLSARYDLQRELANKLNKDYTLSEAEFRQVGYYINDLMLVSYLTSRGLSIRIPDGIEYYKSTNSGTPTTSIGNTNIAIDSLYGLASFKSWFENYVIPALKVRKTSSIDYTTNPFIRSLSRTVKQDSRTGRPQSYYQLPINMTNIDNNAKSKMIYEALLSGFNEIANDTFEGNKLSDLFFIYNCIVNKDSVGEHSMTRIFEDIVDTPTSSNYVSGFYDFVSSIDNNPELRKQFRLKTSGIDAAYYIKSFVPNTRIDSNRNIDNYGSDFTYRMPTLLGDFVANKVNVSAYVEPESKYQFELDRKTVLQEVMDFMKTKYPGAIIDHSTAWFEKHKSEFSNDPNIASKIVSEPAFIHDGVVYINTDYADAFDALHEFTHLILAALKFNNDDISKRALYYTLVRSVKTHPEYDTYAREYSELGLQGTDLEEEVFAKIVQEYLKNKVHSEFNSALFEINKSGFVAAISEILQSNIPSDVDLMNLGATRPAAIVKLFGSTLFNLDPSIDLSEETIRWRTETQALRNAGISAGYVNINCD